MHTIVRAEKDDADSPGFPLSWLPADDSGREGDLPAGTVVAVTDGDGGFKITPNDQNPFFFQP